MAPIAFFHERQNLALATLLNNADRIMSETASSALAVIKEVAKLFQQTNQIVAHKNQDPISIYFIMDEKAEGLLLQIAKHLTHPNEPFEIAQRIFKKYLTQTTIHLNINHQEDWNQWKQKSWNILWKDYSKTIPLCHHFIKISGFQFVLIRLNLYLEFVEFSRKKTASDHCSVLPIFLKEQGFEQAVTPFKIGDVILYYEQKNIKALTHAALVHDTPDSLIAKIGDQTPFASIYSMDLSPLEYGPYYQIWRKTEEIR